MYVQIYYCNMVVKTDSDYFLYHDEPCLQDILISSAYVLVFRYFIVYGRYTHVFSDLHFYVVLFLPQLPGQPPLLELYMWICAGPLSALMLLSFSLQQLKDNPATTNIDCAAV